MSENRKISELLKEGISQLFLLILTLGLFMQIEARGFDADGLAEVFDFAGDAPYFEQSEINGMTQIKVSFRAAAPFEVLGEYYRELLSSRGWLVLPFDPAMLNPALAFGTQRMIFMHGSTILVFMQHSIKNETFLSLCLMEGMPSPVPDMEKVRECLAEGLMIYGSRPVLQYRGMSNLTGSTVLLTFSTGSAADFVMDFFSRELGGRGWEESRMIGDFASEIMRLSGTAKLPFERFRFFRKSGTDEVLFLFTAPDPSASGSMYGYFHRK